MVDIVRMAKEHSNRIIRKSLDLTSRPKDKEELTETEILLLLTACANEYSCTPDACELERKGLYTPVIVYCNIMQGGNRYSVIENIYRKKDDNGLSINQYVFTKEKYAVWQTRDGVNSIPVALTSRAKLPIPYAELSEVEREWMCRYKQLTPYPFHLKGRLYFVRSDMMKELDKEKQNGILFRRRIVDILVPYRIQMPDPGYGHPLRQFTTGHLLTREDVHEMQAYMYIGRKEYWEQFTSALEACSLYDPNLRYLRDKPNRFVFADRNKRWSNEPYYFFNAWEVNNK